MALSMNTSIDAVNVTIQNAYVRIEQVQCNRFETGIGAVARCYQSNPGFPPNIPAFKEISFSVPLDLNGGNPFKQAYIGAKALPMFAGATDC
jgi:hypothetical protein